MSRWHALMWATVVAGGLTFHLQETEARPVGDVGATSCSDREDVRYKVERGDLFENIVAARYGQLKPDDLKKVLNYIHLYNRDKSNHYPADPRNILPGQVLYLPACIETTNHTVLQIREADADAANVPERVADAGAGDTLDDGADAGDAGSVDDGAQDAAVPNGGDSGLDRPVFVADVSAGGVMPLGEQARRAFFRYATVIGVGGRFRAGPIELSPRLLLVGGWHGTVFNALEVDQTLLGIGGSAQIGRPFEPTSWLRITPGGEIVLLAMKRTITREDYPFEGTEDVQSGILPAAGVYLRADYVFSKHRLTLGVEGSLDITLATLPGAPWGENINAKVLGGMTYGF